MAHKEDQSIFDRVLPNGKRLGDCTMAEVREMAEQYRQGLPERSRQKLDELLEQYRHRLHPLRHQAPGAGLPMS